MTSKFKPIEDLPTKEGYYGLMVEGVRSTLPITAKFDGRQWDTTRIKYYQKMGHQIYYLDNEPTP